MDEENFNRTFFCGASAAIAAALFSAKSYFKVFLSFFDLFSIQADVCIEACDRVNLRRQEKKMWTDAQCLTGQREPTLCTGLVYK